MEKGPYGPFPANGFTFFERGCSTGMQDKLPALKANIYGLTKLWRNFEYMLNVYKEILILKQYLTL